jgi:hypothetical protein
MELWNYPIDKAKLFLDFFWGGKEGVWLGFGGNNFFLKRYEWPGASYPELTFKYFERRGLFIDNLGAAG